MGELLQGIAGFLMVTIGFVSVIGFACIFLPVCIRAGEWLSEKIQGRY